MISFFVYILSKSILQNISQYPPFKEKILGSSEKYSGISIQQKNFVGDPNF